MLRQQRRLQKCMNLNMEEKNNNIGERVSYVHIQAGYVQDENLLARTATIDLRVGLRAMSKKRDSR